MANLHLHTALCQLEIIHLLNHIVVATCFLLTTIINSLTYSFMVSYSHFITPVHAYNMYKNLYSGDLQVILKYGKTMVSGHFFGVVFCEIHCNIFVPSISTLLSYEYEKQKNMS